MWETSALVELLERKGILSKQEVLDMIQELRQCQPKIRRIPILVPASSVLLYVKPNVRSQQPERETRAPVR